MPNWTDDQQKAIYAPSGEGNILVSAAAGSGKTAVLVERIVNLITGNNPISIDKMLIVTFTEAAAAEMRERIITRINSAYHQSLADGDAKKIKYLKEQINLTASADINTIDAFCLRVVKNNFHVLGIDPNFSIMDNNQSEILIDDALDNLFMSLYSSDNEEERKEFLHLSSLYSSNRNDDGLKAIVKKIHNFTQSFPDPVKWLDDKADMYQNDMSKSRWTEEIFIRDNISQLLKYHKDFWDELIDDMLSHVEEKHGETDKTLPLEENKNCVKFWGKMWAKIILCRDVVKLLENTNDYNTALEIFNTYIRSKAKLGNAIKTYPVDVEASSDLWNKYYKRYDNMRNDLREKCLYLPSLSAEDYNKENHAEEITKTVNAIVNLTKKFLQTYDKLSDKRNLKSFSDVEHLAYKLFSENENIRKEYSEKYDEILIDEYQDTNSLQDTLFTLISRDEKNMFMVGDLKQSIYRFRGGDPMIFKEKNRKYSQKVGGRRISLSQNFRSRRTVIDSINDIFTNIMSNNVGDVNYDKNEALNREEERECYRDNEKNENCNYKSELCLIGKNRQSRLDQFAPTFSVNEAEAYVVATRIRQLIDSKFKIHTGDGNYRNIEYSDIVILMRSVKSTGEIVQDMLQKQGIPSYVQRENYFERKEIRLMITLLSLINNNLQDIPIVSVMRSPIGNFTDNELSKIRLANDKSSFYNALCSYKGDDGELYEKCCNFIKDLNRWRGYVKLKSIASLIWTLYEETGLYDFMGALEGGEEAQANLKLLYERAKTYEDSGFKGIFNFLRYIEQIEERKEDLGSAMLISENHNVVRIMTIHKSKGLEFPVVFLMRTNSNIIRSNSTDDLRIQLHKDAGIGVDYINYEKMYKKELEFNSYIKSKNNAEQLSENLRLLYVALTRAKEKLIVTSANQYRDEDAFYKYISDKESELKSLSIYLIAPLAKTYTDWLLPAALSSKDSWNVRTFFIENIEDFEGQEDKQLPTEFQDFDYMKEEVEKILEYHYTRPTHKSIPTKTSVTAIKELADEELIREDDTDNKPIFMSQRPDFMRTERLGTQIGTAHHQFMAYVDIDKLRLTNLEEYDAFVQSELERLTDTGYIDEEFITDKSLADMICKNISSFWKSDLGKTVLFAKSIHREAPFEITISADEYDKTLGDEYKDEEIILQGIIDLYFTDENDDITLVDYKTDKCKTKKDEEQIVKRYEKQITLYARAMEKILKKPVKNKYLYLFSSQSVVKLN